MIMNREEDKRCAQVAELFKPFLDEGGDWCVVRSEKFGYIVLMYYTNGRFEDNCTFDNAEDLFQHLLDHWKFRWLYEKAKENGTAEYEDYEKELTEEQKKQRECAVKKYKLIYQKIVE